MRNVSHQPKKRLSGAPSHVVSAKANLNHSGIALPFPTRQNGCCESPVQPEDSVPGTDHAGAHRRAWLPLPRRLAMVRRLLHGADHDHHHWLWRASSAVDRRAASSTPSSSLPASDWCCCSSAPRRRLCWNSSYNRFSAGDAWTARSAACRTITSSAALDVLAAA